MPKFYLSMNKNVKVSIILPNYNIEKYLIKTVKSVLNQTFKNWELIIVDDNSNLNTLNVLKRFKRNKKIRIFYLKKNKGAGYCRNYAIKKSKSTYLAFIDSDDIWENNKLKKQIKFMRKNNCSFSYTNYKTFGDRNKKVNNPSKLNYSSFIKDTSIATSTMMVERKKIDSIKFTNTKICEDYYFKCKLLKKVNFAFCLNKFLTKYRIRKNSLQSNVFRNFFWIWKINKDYNKLNFIENFFSLLNISINSLKKYNGKHLF